MVDTLDDLLVWNDNVVGGQDTDEAIAFCKRHDYDIWNYLMYTKSVIKYHYAHEGVLPNPYEMMNTYRKYIEAK